MKERLKEWAASRRPESGGFIGVTEDGEYELDTQTFLLSLVPAAFGILFYTRFGPIYGLGVALVLVLIEGIMFRTLSYLLSSYK